MSENKEVYLHIGYPKTATTTLQNYLFPYHKEIYYLRRYGKHLNFLSDLFFARENAFDRKKNSIKKELKNYITDSKVNKFVYSEESLTSFSMFFRFQPRPYIWTLEPNSMARKLKTAFLETKVFNKTKIIITIRKQDSMLKSMYAQVYNFVFKKLRETNTFEKFLNYSLLENKDSFIVDSLMYYDVIKTYSDLFGKENVLVLVFEELKENKESYIKKLSEFMHIDYRESIDLVGDHKVNSRSSSSGVYPSDERNVIEYLSYYKNKYLGNKALSLSNNFFVKKLSTIYMPGKKLKVNISEKYQIMINDQFCENNKKLAEEYNLELKKYGYY
ncbi:putative Sulfotransferase domain-containing protein [Candidatus Magnetomoraceae bacterium gMMP-1]